MKRYYIKRNFMNVKTHVHNLHLAAVGTAQVDGGTSGWLRASTVVDIPRFLEIYSAGLVRTRRRSSGRRSDRRGNRWLRLV